MGSVTSPLLLDTHCLLWWLAQPERLSSTATEALHSSTAEIFVSAATGWEIATKKRLGKLDIPDEIVAELPAHLGEQGFTPLAVELNHALRAGGYSQSHGDPFDRMLAAQAELEGLTLLSNDQALQAFPCDVLW
jgi:PIN domain nuclease of toxin-antitoxin system